MARGRPDPRSLARLARSPVALGGGAAGAALAAVLGAPVVATIGVGLAGWAGGAFVASLPTRLRQDSIDPFALGLPWRRFVQDALQARARFHEVVSGTAEGPLRERLAQIGERIETAVEECWLVAGRAQSLATARRRIDKGSLGRRRAELEGDDSELGERRSRALEAHMNAAERLEAAVEDAKTRLELLDVKLQESVTRTVEIAALSGGSDQLATLGADVDDLVDEIEALRQALEETGKSP